MNNSEILKTLGTYKEHAAGRYGITRLGIFGSYAKGKETEKSDVDIIVDLESPDIFYMVHIKEELEEVLGLSVDIVRNRDKMNPFLKKNIEKDAIYV